MDGRYEMCSEIKFNITVFNTTRPTHTHTHTHAPTLHASWCDPTCWLFFPPRLVCILQFLSSLSSMGSCLLFSCVCDLRWQIKWLTSPPAHWSDILMVFWVKGVSGHHTSERVVDVKLGLGRIPTRKTMHYVLVIHQTGLMIRSIFEDISSVINLQ